jgi:hypothetical protein
MSDTRDVARCWAGSASLGVGHVHLAVVEEHFDESALFGIFVVSGVLPIAWAMVALWAVTRTVRLPLGPGRYLLLVGAGALAVACTTTPALAATGEERGH